MREASFAPSIDDDNTVAGGSRPSRNKRRPAVGRGASLGTASAPIEAANEVSVSAALAWAE